MISISRLFVLGLALVAATGCSQSSVQKHSAPRENNLTVMSYNIRFDDKSDGPEGWQQRKERVAHLITFYNPDFLGTQEALLHQLEYLDSELGAMDRIGVGRDDGKNGGEFSALFYNTDRFELVAGSDSTIWLSKTPEKPSKNWDAALPRILTWGKFKDTRTGAHLLVFNTHFDHVGDTARAESAKLILEKINTIAGETPAILTGDFNFTPQARPYSILTAPAGLLDTHEASAAPHIGPAFTFSGFKVNPDIQKRRIDYIFTTSGIMTTRHGAISDFRDGYYPSDHLPVISELSITNPTSSYEK